MSENSVAFATRILADKDTTKQQSLQFCHLFPQDHFFYKDDIIRLWESLFRTEAESLFEEFEKENVFELSQFDPSTQRPMYKINTLVVDLLKLHHDGDFIQINGDGSDIAEQSHSASICRAVDPTFLEKFFQPKSLQTLLILQRQKFPVDGACRRLFQNQPLLVCLDLSHSEITDLPSSISELHQLRYLNLSHTPIITLPDSLCDIPELQTLNLRGCIKLLGLPKALRKLRNLCHFDVDVECLLVSMPPGVGALENLQTLPAFVVGKENGHRLTELKNLTNLRGTICIFMLENISSSDEAKEAALDKKSNLENLELNWQAKKAALQDDFQVLQNLRPHRNIKELQIVGYGGAKFPGWLGDPLFSVLKTLTIHNSSHCKILPSLGKLPFLNSLDVSFMNEVKIMDHQFCGRNIDAETSKGTNDANKFEAFPRLEKLTLDEMPGLKEWIEVEDGDFQQLQKLNISGCSKLETLPDLSLFKALRQLEITQCPSLNTFTGVTLPTSLGSLTLIDCPLVKPLCHEYLAENQGKLEHISSVWIDDEQTVLVHRETSNEWKPLSEEAEISEEIGVIEELVDESKMFMIRGELVETFASRKDATKKIIDALKNNHLNMVGVFGMAGVGKTFLTEKIMKHVRDEKIFDQVVMVIISQNPNIRRIQNDIAEQLDLHLSESLKTAAEQLSARLSGGPKVLIVLDDIWKRLDIRGVGIPYKSKILFTTRSKVVCDVMETEETIEVGVLSKNDSWELFRQKAGDVVDNPSHQEVAYGVLNECKGLPFAIVTLGLALRSKDVIVWHDAHTQLKKSMYNNGMGLATAVVKLSYEFLHGDKAAQMCFLYCSLFPEGFQIKIDVLLSYLFGEKLMEDVDTIGNDGARMGGSIFLGGAAFGKKNSSQLSPSMVGRVLKILGWATAPPCPPLAPSLTIGEARQRLHVIVDKLTSSGILLRNKGGDIMMHDIIRDTAICIASDPEEGEGFIVKSGLGLEEWLPIDREMKNCKRLSLMSNNLKFIPPFTASLLSILSLSQNKKLEEIPSDFFKEMKQLKTLDLSSTGIRFLPPSIVCLQSLRTLLMDECFNLFDISLVGELETLNILSIRHSKGLRVPKSMKKLTNLIILKASNTIFPFRPEEISSLYRLEELYLGVDEFDDISLEEIFLKGRAIDKIFSKLAKLTRLTCLEICLADHNLHSRGRHLIVSTRYMNARKSQFSNLEELRLSGFQLRCLSIPEDFLLKLKKLKVSWCPMMPILIPFDLLANLQKLEEIKVTDCKELMALVPFEGSMSKQPHSLIFPCLRRIVISSCPSLWYVLPIEAARHLLQLEELEISDCSYMDVIFNEGWRENANRDKLILPRLKALVLRSLPSLSSFGPPGLLFDFPALVKMKVEDCKNWRMLPLLDAHSVPKLKELKLDSGWLDGLEWEDESLKFHLKSLPGLVESKH